RSRTQVGGIVTEIRFAKDVRAALKGAEVVVVVAPKKALDAGWHRKVLGTKWARTMDAPAEDVKPGDLGNVATTYGSGAGAPRRMVVGAVPDKVSRHNSPARAESIRHCVEQAKIAGKTSVVVVQVPDAGSYVPAGVAVARCL